MRETTVRGPTNTAKRSHSECNRTTKKPDDKFVAGCGGWSFDFGFGKKEKSKTCNYAAKNQRRQSLIRHSTAQNIKYVRYPDATPDVTIPELNILNKPPLRNGEPYYDFENNSSQQNFKNDFASDVHSCNSRIVTSGANKNRRHGKNKYDENDYPSNDAFSSLPIENVFENEPHYPRYPTEDFNKNFAVDSVAQPSHLVKKKSSPTFAAAQNFPQRIPKLPATQAVLLRESSKQKQPNGVGCNDMLLPNASTLSYTPAYPTEMHNTAGEKGNGIVMAYDQPVAICGSSNSSMKPVPILRIDMPKDAYDIKITREQAPLKNHPCSVQQPTTYELNPVRIDSQEKFLELPSDVQAALIQNMQGKLQTLVNPSVFEQVQKKPEVEKCLTDPPQFGERGLLMGTGQDNPFFQQLQQQIQQKQMELFKEQFYKQKSIPPNNFNTINDASMCKITAPRHVLVPARTMHKTSVISDNTGIMENQFSSINLPLSDQSLEKPIMLENNNEQQFTDNPPEITRSFIKTFMLNTFVRKPLPDGSLGDEELVTRQVTMYRLLHSPELIEYESFMTTDECDHMTALACIKGWSSVITKSSRPHHNKKKSKLLAECNLFEAEQRHPLIKTITARAAKCLGVSENAIISFKVYKISLNETTNLTCGESLTSTRVLLVYLNDLDEGGETEFPMIGIAVAPKKGYGLGWNNEKNIIQQLQYRNLPITTETAKYYIEICSH